MKEERRRAPRIDRRLMMRYRSPASGKTQWMVSPLRDISAMGIRFIGDTGFPVGTVLEVQMQLPMTTKPLTVMARVVWLRGGTGGKMAEHGVEFIDLTPPARQQIAQATEFFLRRRET